VNHAKLVKIKRLKKKLMLKMPKKRRKELHHVLDVLK